MSTAPLTLGRNPIGQPFAEAITATQATTNDWVELEGSRLFLAGATVVQIEILPLDIAHVFSFRVFGSWLSDFSDAEMFALGNGIDVLQQMNRRMQDGTSMHRYYRIEIKSDVADTPSLVQARFRAY